MTIDLTKILTEAGYTTNWYNGTLGYVTSMHIDTWIGGWHWKHGQTVFTTYGKPNSESWYTCWFWSRLDILGEVLNKLQKRVLVMRTIPELDGAVRAYDSLNHRCLVVPRLEFNQWEYDMYLEKEMSREGFEPSTPSL